MPDYVLFLKDLSLDGELLFRRGIKYEILDEDSEYYYIQQKKGTNKVSQFPKTEEGDCFRLIK